MSGMCKWRRHADDVDVNITEAVYGDDLHGRRHRRDKGDIEVIAWGRPSIASAPGCAATSKIGTSDVVNLASNSAAAPASMAGADHA